MMPKDIMSYKYVLKVKCEKPSSACAITQYFKTIDELVSCVTQDIKNHFDDSTFNLVIGEDNNG